MVRPLGYEQNRHPGWELIDMLDAMGTGGLNVIQINTLVTSRYDYIAITYNAAGDIDTVVYRTGGALGAIVATLTLGYNAFNKLVSVTKT